MAMHEKMRLVDVETEYRGLQARIAVRRRNFLLGS